MKAWLNRMPIGEDSLPVPGFRVEPRLAPRWLSMTKPAASKIQNGSATMKPIVMPTNASLATISSVSPIPPLQLA